jgi:hypothetical protein
MRKLFLALFIPVLFILGTPALLGAIMYDGSGDDHLPTDLYTEDADAMDMILKELDDSLLDVENGITDDMVFNLSADIINTGIFQGIREGVNPDYMPNDNCTSTEEKCNYVVYEPISIQEGMNLELKVVGLWVDFEDLPSANERINSGMFVLNIFVEVTVQDGFTYKTIISTHFIISDNQDDNEYSLEFDKVAVGNLPVPKAIITTILDTAGVDLEEQVNDSLPAGIFKQSDFSFTIGKQEIVEQMDSEGENGEVDANMLLAQELFGTILEDYVSFDVDDDEVKLEVAVSLLKNDDVTGIPAYLMSLHDVEVVDGVNVYGAYNPDAFDPEAYLQDTFAEYIFNRAFTGDPAFYLNESVINKLIYAGANGFEDMSVMQEIPTADGGTKEIEVGLKALWFEFEEGPLGGEVYAKALFKIAGINSLLEIKTVNVSEDATQLVFDFDRITIGKDEGEDDGDYTVFENTDVFKQVLSEMKDIEFGEFTDQGQFIISVDALSSMMTDDSAQGGSVPFNITEIGVVEGAIFLTVVPENQQLQDVLDSLTDNLNNIIGDGSLTEGLGEVLNIDEPGPEQDIYNDVLALQEAMSEGDTETLTDPENIEEMFTTFEQLDPEAQAAFMDTFQEEIDPSIFSEFEDLFTGGDIDPNDLPQ